MNEKQRNIVLILVLLVVVVIAAAVGYNALSGRVQTPSEPSAPAASSGSGIPGRQMAPDATVYDSEGNAVKLSEFRGKPVVLNFWASWCPPCKEEMPAFETAYIEMGGEVHFLMVDLVDGSQETPETGAAYIAGQGYTFSVYYDTDQDAAMNYGVRAIPTTVVIDKEGYIVKVKQGMIDEETLRDYIAQGQ